MKKLGLTLVMAMMAVMLVAGGAWALPFSSTGFVNANYQDSWDVVALTGTALFELYIDEAWPVVTQATLEFENDVFDFTLIDKDDFTVLNPSGWTTSLTTGTNGYKFSASLAGTPATSSNDPIRITYKYALLSADRYNQLSGVNWIWDEGQPWGIAYTLLGQSNNQLDYSSGSTAPVPEPGTMALLGIGLLGLAFVGRRKLKIEE